MTMVSAAYLYRSLTGTPVPDPAAGSHLARLEESA
jgi:hypothetical protein